MDQPPRIGRYSLVRRVGAGGFATVWLARDEQLDAEVAIKILSENWIEDDDVRRRFLAHFDDAELDALAEAWERVRPGATD